MSEDRSGAEWEGVRLRQPATRCRWLHLSRVRSPSPSLPSPAPRRSNLDRILLLADKWNIASVVCVAQEFLLLPSTTFSTAEGDVSNVWRLLVLADRWVSWSAGGWVGARQRSQ